MKILSSVGLLVVAIAGLPGPAQGQGWYLGSELGAHVVPVLGMTGLSNDRASVCDEFINPQYATVTQAAGYEAYNCTGPDRRNDWINQFARATGLQTSWVLGHRFGADASGPRWRVGGEFVGIRHRSIFGSREPGVPRDVVAMA